MTSKRPSLADNLAADTDIYSLTANLFQTVQKKQSKQFYLEAHDILRYLNAQKQKLTTELAESSKKHPPAELSPESIRDLERLDIIYQRDKIPATDRFENMESRMQARSEDKDTLINELRIKITELRISKLQNTVDELQVTVGQLQYEVI